MEYTKDTPSQMVGHACQHEGEIAVMSKAIIEIKDSISQIKDLITSNAVLEEQVSYMRDSLNHAKKDIDELKVSLAKQAGSNSWIEKIVWFIISGGAGVLIGKGII